MATENKYVIRLDNTVSYELDNNYGIIEGVETSYPYPSTSGHYANTFNDISFDENDDALELLPALLEVPEYYDDHLTSNHLIAAIVKDRWNYVRVAPISYSSRWCFNVYNGMPVCKDNVGTDYSVADFNADKLAGTLPEHLYVETYNEGEPVYIPYPISALYNTFEVSDVASDTPPAPPGPTPDNNLASVKLGDKVLSINEYGEGWDDVSAMYNNVGGTLQTEFQYEDGGTPTPPDATGGYFISSDGKIWSLERWDGMDYIYASPLGAAWDGSKYSLPLYFDTYVMPTIYSDFGLQNPLTEFPHEGDTFYYLDSNVQTVANAVLYSTMTAGTTATYIPPVPPVTTYDKPLIYNKDLDCIEKSLGNIEVTGDFKAASITTPKLHATEATIDDLTVTNPVENLTVENLTVTDTASINHATIVTEEDIHSEADFIELRVDNPLPTPSTGSGFKVKNYDGNNNNLELVTDSNGTFRIGAENSLQPIATREEATALNNNDLLAWDSTTNQLKHITRPTVNGTALKAIVANGAVTGYDWGSSGGSGVSFIGTRAAYNTAKLIPEGQDGYIPAGSLVIITDEDELLIGDEVQ